MSNLADMIERLILSKFAAVDDDILVFRRNEVADEISCAPSQISYVLSTRFTAARGFVVESRRGLGGFVRIARVPVAGLVYDDIAMHVSDRTTLAELERTVARLSDSGLMTVREAFLMGRLLEIVFQCLQPAQRAPLVRDLFAEMAARE